MLCQCSGMLVVDLVASRFSIKLRRFGLVTPWDQFTLIYPFPPIQLLKHQLHRIKVETCNSSHSSLAQENLEWQWTGALNASNSSGPSASNLPSFTVTGFNGLIIKTRVLMDRGLPKALLKASKEASRCIYHRAWKSYVAWFGARRLHPCTC